MNFTTRWNKNRLLTVVGLFAVITALATGIGGCRKKDAPPSVQELLTLLADQDPDMRYSAAKQLGKQGKAAAQAVPALIGALSDKAAVVRMGAAYALAGIGPAEPSATQPLALVVRDEKEDAEVRQAAAYALSCMGPDAGAALPALAVAARSTNAELRQEAAGAIKKIEAAARFRDAGQPPPAEPEPE